ncbi:MAG: hypothetical protein M3Y34_09515, partial [Actinomycetota bacterium]|nr:hypothetical protein [Actinomycetota bacterium]
RDEIATETTRLAEELLSAVERVRRSDAAADQAAVPTGAAASPASPEPVAEPPTGDELLEDEPGEEPTTGNELVDEGPGEELPEEEEETQFHPGPDSEETDIFENDPEERRAPRLLVDPDEET